MKRDMDLARDILFAIEASDDARLRLSVRISGRSETEIAYHVKLLCEAGLVDALDVSSPEQLRWIPGHLTWAGHEFLDAARRDTLWERAKTETFNRTGGFALELLQGMLMKLARRELGL